MRRNVTKGGARWLGIMALFAVAATAMASALGCSLHLGASILTPKPVMVVPTPLSNEDLMVVAAWESHARSIAAAQVSMALQAAAREHASYMAEHCSQGHQNWSERKRQIEAELPGFNVEECVAESWLNQTSEDAAVEMFHSWRQTSHWELVDASCDLIGFSMAQGCNGVYYGCGLFATVSHAKEFKIGTVK